MRSCASASTRYHYDRDGRGYSLCCRQHKVGNGTIRGDFRDELRRALMAESGELMVGARAATRDLVVSWLRLEIPMLARDARRREVPSTTAMLTVGAASLEAFPGLLRELLGLW